MCLKNCLIFVLWDSKKRGLLSGVLKNISYESLSKDNDFFLAMQYKCCLWLTHALEYPMVASAATAYVVTFIS